MAGHLYGINTLSLSEMLIFIIAGNTFLFTAIVQQQL